MRPVPSAIRLGLVVWFVAVATFSYAPFQPGYRGPKLVENGASRGEAGALVFEGPARVRTSGPPAWLAEALAEEQLTIALSARSAGPDQRGPARLLSNSNGPYERNFMVAQQGPDLFVRVRRPGADTNGAPPLKVDGVFQTPGPHDLEVRFASDSIEVLVDGQRRILERLPSDLFARWDPSFPMALGDEIDGARGWRGELRWATASVSDQAFDLLAGELDLTPTFWDIPEDARRFWRFDPSLAGLVFAVHAALFLPLGLLLWLSARTHGARRSALTQLLGILAAAGFIGIMLQLGKLGFVGRHPSIYHALPDGLGALIGALIGRRIWPKSS